ncbi:unnamed protein product [Rotaria magnacalcarata]|uniref:IRG-type G domain-containing protein n=1 Tax=Rotaria magnacalcarata TaxID=392030 RepID=A0A816ZT60_9BILA|nr:unnamed protein product [Rotaria magnacalcarata]CAF4267222.1 unnamed protein product [Rotaria magnacalcarata]
MRDLKPTDVGAAKIGVTECIMTVHEYSDPKNPNFIYYDLPGVGTANFPRDRYFMEIKNRTTGKIEYNDFDFFFILSAGRFTEEDIWLVKRITSLNKKFYFIRTKIDQDPRNSKDDHPDTYKEDIILQQIRENCEDELKKVLINNSCNENKQAFKIFLIGGAVHIFGTSLVGDALIAYKCYEYYKQAFGLDDGSLTTLANIHNTTIAAIKAYMSTTVWSDIFLGGQVASFIIIQAGEEGSKKAAQKAASELSKTTLKFIPFFGSVVAGVISFDATYHRLYCLINKMEEATIAVLQFVTKQTGDSELSKLKTD